jgi:hypothetical protein
MHEHEKEIPIWFFIGGLLAIYGVIISVYGVVAWNQPPPPTMPEEISNLHAPAWWGALVAALGIFYVVKFWPAKAETLTGKAENK